MKIGTIKGIEIKLHISTLLIVALVGFYVASFYNSLIPEATISDLLTVGLANGVLILGSILVHELLHSIYAQRYGLKVREIELYVFGGASKIEEEPKTPKEEIIIAAVGPLSSLVIGFSLIALLFLPINYSAILAVTFFYGGFSNILLGIFNFLPGFPMDGGRVLRSILWKRRGDLVSATRTAAKVGNAFGYGFIAYGFFEIFFFGSFGGLWLILIGSFLNNAARSEYLETVNQMKLSNINVESMISPRNIPIPFKMLIRDAIRDYFMLYKVDYFPVVQNHEIVGILHIDDIRRVPLDQHSSTIVGYVMRPLSGFPSIHNEDSGKEAYKQLKSIEDFPPILVVKGSQDEHIMGFISKEDLAYALRFAGPSTRD